LMTLGYKPADADKLVRKAVSSLGPDASVEALLRSALS
ncbi:MAG: Holliday junction branch migration protein RuvA, partial [Puniceicoccaceae bacterium]